MRFNPENLHLVAFRRSRLRARPPKRKTRITLYLDDEVLDAFRSRAERTGTGYQTPVNAALRIRLAVQEASAGPA